jgi:hypothetical protein
MQLRLPRIGNAQTNQPEISALRTPALFSLIHLIAEISGKGTKANDIPYKTGPRGLYDTTIR